MRSTTANSTKEVSAGRVLIGLLNGSFLTKSTVVKQVPYMLFLVALMIVYIGYGYYAEKTVRKVYRMDATVKELKSEYTTTFSRLETKKQQSNVAENVAKIGLQESRVPPFKIEVEK